VVITWFFVFLFHHIQTLLHHQNTMLQLRKRCLGHKVAVTHYFILTEWAWLLGKTSTRQGPEPNSPWPQWGFCPLRGPNVPHELAWKNSNCSLVMERRALSSRPHSSPHIHSGRANTSRPPGRAERHFTPPFCSVINFSASMVSQKNKKLTWKLNKQRGQRGHAAHFS